MITENITEKKIKISEKDLQKHIKETGSFEETLYLDLGVKTVRIICYSELFIPHIKKQLAFSYCETSSNYDTTIILWNEKVLEQIQKIRGLFVYDNGEKDLIDFVRGNNTISANTSDNKTFYYGVKNLEPEEFVKEGHIFAQILYKILKTDTTNMVHGACIGLNNKGILLCARGQKGKSTLAVLSMLLGFEYVSDDYLTLEKVDDKLFAYPIYSIITLSPRMYNELYDRLEGTRFLSNNARKDKYVINIANFHKQFKTKYPVEIGMSLEFTTENTPSIIECTNQEKGKAITQMIHSTITQMLEMYDSATIKKLIEMINGFKYYKLYLCNDIYKNVECLKEFMKEQIID